MTRFLSHLAAAITAAALPLAGVAVATAAESSAGCDPNWSHILSTNECHPQPKPPDWYTVRPAYAPPYAPVDVPPPPSSPPPWAPQQHPVWDQGSQNWVWVRF